MSVIVNMDGFLMGAGTDYEIAPEGIGGLLGTPTVRTSDVPRGHDDGSVAGFDYYDARLVTIPVTVRGDTPAECLQNLEALIDAWAVSDTDLTLAVTMWGLTYTLTGRPREVEEDSVENLHAGVVEVTCVFFAPDPYLAGLS